MILKSLHIDRFGILSGQTAEKLAPGLNIFLGHNEAGKSTLLNFFRAMFFGYKRKNKIRFDQANAKNASAGGELRLAAADGRQFRIARRPGAHGGELAIFDGQGRDLPPEIWTGLLSGVTAELYDNVFAFDLEDISSLSGMNDSQVASALHGAAFGTGFKSPAQVLKTLEAAQQELFAPSHASKKRINLILQRLQEVKRALDEGGSDMERHAALTAERQTSLGELEKSEERIRELNFSLSRLQSLQQAQGLWQEMKRLEGELTIRRPPEGRFAPDSLTRLESLCGEREARQTALEARGLELDNPRRLLREEQPEAELLDSWPRLRALRNRRAAAERILESLPGLERECRDLRESQEQLLAGLGTGWTAEKALASGLSVAMRDRLADFQQRLEDGRLAFEYEKKRNQHLEEQYQGALVEEARLRAARGQALQFEQAGPERELPAELFGPELRLILEEKGRRVERAQLAASAATEACRARERERAGLGDEFDELRVAVAAAEATLPSAEALEERGRDLAALRRNCEQAVELEEALDEARRALAAHKRPLLSLTPLARDRRRLAPALLCAALGLLALYQPFSALRGGADLPALLAGGWPSICLGLLGLWLCLFWLSPTFAFFGLLRPRPSFLETRPAELAERSVRLALQRGELAARVGAWLASGLRGLSLSELTRAVSAGEGLLAGWRQEQVRLRFLREQGGQLERKLAGLERGLEEAGLAAREAAQQAEDARLAWSACLQPYGLSCGPDTASGAALQIFDRAAHCSALGEELRQSGRRLQASGNELEAVRAEWAAWLASAGFQESLAPAAVLEALALIEKYRDRHLLLERKKSEAGAMREELALFRVEFASVARQWSEAPDRELPGAFDALYAAAEAAARQQDLQIERQKDLLNLEARLAEAEASLRQCDQALEEIFRLAGIRSSNGADGEETPRAILERAEEFRLRHDECRVWENLQQELARAGLQLERHAAARTRCGTEVEPGASTALWSDFQEFSTALDNVDNAAGNSYGEDSEELSAAVAALQSELEADAGAQRLRHTRLGEIGALLEELERGSGSLTLRQEEAGLREELESLARRWTVLGLARSFILGAKRSFEEERQDMVVRRAGDYFREMTGEAYQGLNFDLEGGAGKAAREKQGLRAMALPRSGNPLDSAESLSRGTREQLYLALRLAYISQHNQTRESLPVIMDDILVNFDPERAARAIRVLERFSAGNQVIFFTCHPHLAELLAAGVENSATFNIAGGVIA